MTPKRMYFTMLAAIFILSAAILGGAYGVQLLLQSKSDQLVSLKAKLAAFNAQQVSLVQAKKDITEYTELYNIAKAIVPENKNQAETVRQIVKLAQESSVSLGSITFPSSTLGSGAVGGSRPSTGTTSLTPTTPKVDTNKAALSQLTPVAGSPGVYVMQINVASDTTNPATYDEIITFLSALERNRLTAEVTTVNIIPSANTSSGFSFTLSVNTYIKP